MKLGGFGLTVSAPAPTDTFVTAHGKIMATPAFAVFERLVMAP